MLDSTYHMTLRLLWNFISDVKNCIFFHYVSNVVMNVITFPKICKPLLDFIAWRYITLRRNVISTR